MIPFTGRSSIKQYMKDKPNKWGFKMWKLVDSMLSYLYASDIYMGKAAEREVELGQHVLAVGQRIAAWATKDAVFWQFFSPVDLIDQLYERGIFATATIRPNLAGVPIEVKNARLDASKLVWGMKDPQMVVTKGKDTKDVLLISSMCRATPSENDFVTKAKNSQSRRSRDNAHLV